MREHILRELEECTLSIEFIHFYQCLALGSLCELFREAVADRSFFFNTYTSLGLIYHSVNVTGAIKVIFA